MQSYKYIYVIECKSENPIYKVGYAYNVNKRLIDLQVGCPYPLEIIKVIRSFDAPRTEAELHQALDEYRVVGEWFKAPLDVILSKLDKYSEGFAFYYWMYVFEKLGVKYRIIDDNSIRLIKDNVICSFYDFEPDRKTMIEIGDASSRGQQVNIILPCLPYVTKKRIGYQSSIFMHVFAGSFLDVFPASVCDMDFSKYSKRQCNDTYGRYRFFRRACFVVNDGKVKISNLSDDVSEEFYCACKDAMSYAAEDIKGAWDNLDKICDNTVC